MKIPDKVYEILKWLVLIFLPALSTFYCTIASDLGLPAPDTVAKFISAACLFIGAIVGISTAGYYKAKNDQKSE